jgi:ketosteroid isomerase-like protein
VRASSKPFDRTAVYLMTFRAGRITRWEIYIDTPQMLAALQA